MFTAIATDAGGISKIEIFINGSMATSGKTSPCVYVSRPFPAGTVTYNAVAYDKVGNKAATKSLSFNVTTPKRQQDTIVPMVKAVHSPENPTTLDKVTFTAKAADAGGISRIELFINHRLVRTTGEPSISYTSDPFPEGTVRYTAVAYDKAGNVASSGEHTFIVKPVELPDLTKEIRRRPPVRPVHMSYQPFYPTSLDRITFTARAFSDSVKKMIMSVGSYRNEYGFMVYPPVAENNTSFCEYTGGPYAAGSMLPFTVYAFDENNEQIWVGTQEVMVADWDNIPPQVDITYSPAEPTTQDIVVFTATASDASGRGVGKVQISVNGSVVRTGGYRETSCTWSGKLHEGRNTYSAKAWDLAYNSASSPEGEINVTDVPAEHVWVHGNLQYEDKFEYPLYSPATEFRPIRAVELKLVAGSHTYNCTTDVSGFFSFIIDRPTEFYLKLKAGNPAARVERDYDWCNEYVWWESAKYPIPGNASSVDLGNMRVGADTNYEFTAYWQENDTLFCGSSKHQFAGGSAYFNIAETIRREWEYATGHRDDDDSIGKVSVAYPDSNTLQGSNSIPWTNPFYGEIYLPCDPDVEEGRDFGFVDETILHEYAHHLTEEISENDWALATHELCTRAGWPLNADEFAWFEGFAEYLSHFLIKGSVNSSEKLSFERTKFVFAETPNCPNLGTGVEGAVFAVLWDLADDSSQGEPWDTVNGEDDTIFKIFDTEMDNYVDAPIIQEFVFCPRGWLARFGNDPRGAAILPILAHHGMPTSVGMTWGGCGGN